MRLFPATCLVLSAVALASAQVAQKQEPAAKPADKAADERVVVTRPMVPVPDVGDGAAYHTPEDLQAQHKAAIEERAEASVSARECQPTPGSTPVYFGNTPTLEILFRDEQAAAVMLGAAAQKAQKATEAALKSRADAYEGVVDMKAVERAELDRQAAVKALDQANDKFVRAHNRTADWQALTIAGRSADISWMELDAREQQRRRFPPEDMAREFADLKLTEVKAVEVRDKKKGDRFLRVSGRIINNRKTAITVPAIFVSAVDERGFALSTRKVEAGRGQQISAGAGSPFVYDMKPLPAGTVTAVVHLASRKSPPPHLDPHMFCGDGTPFGPDAAAPVLR
jgi:hypothetical protein